MRLNVFRTRNLFKMLSASFIILCASLTVSTWSIGGIPVFTNERDLPIYSVDTPDKVASLTFDCAWGASDIPSILDTLKNEEVKATFFFVGQWAKKNPDAIKAISEAGHDIGNHSYSHLRMGSIDEGRIRYEIEACGKKLSELTGNKIELFRAPYGDYNNSVIRSAKALKYYTIQWNVDSLDWKPGISRDEIHRRVLEKIKPGSIMLFHNDTAHTANILPAIIKSVKNKGYSLLPVSQLIYREDFTIDFEGRQRKNE